MFDRLEIKALSAGARFAPVLRLWVNGEDVVDEPVGVGGRGPYAADVLPADRPSLLRATGEARRLRLGGTGLHRWLLRLPDRRRPAVRGDRAVV
ncbi:hypothetical protein [Streptomyces sp. NPDC053431]|uniref:hypothetical protein n=1 Tax=Streptomyces sp. NPDC053431 TaxID=3365703 RepID=UPI0037CED594